VGEPLDHLAFSPGGLDQVDPRCRQCSREHEPWEARPGAEVRNPLRRAQLWDLEPRQAVGDVDIERLPGFRDCGVRIRFRGESVKQPLNCVYEGLRIVDLEAPDGLGHRFT
jgi:hypothetical protein